MKQHAWLKDYNFQALLDKKIPAPFLPSPTEDNFDLKHVNNSDWKDHEVVQENQLLLRRNSVQALFKGYYFDKSSQ